MNYLLHCLIESIYIVYFDSIYSLVTPYLLYVLLCLNFKITSYIGLIITAMLSGIILSHKKTIKVTCLMKLADAVAWIKSIKPAYN